MSWIVRPTLIVPGRPDAECLALARGLYRAVTWKHSSAFVVQAEGSTPEDLQSAWQRLISAIQELESGEIETTGLSGMETFEVRFIVVCNADEGSIWESARKIYRSAEELGNSSEGLVIVAAQRLSDTCERAALKFRQDCSWVPVLIEGRNSKGFPVPEAQVRDSVLTIVDLIVNSASPAEAALETFLQTSGRERRIILGAAVFDPGRDVLEALHLAAVDANYPLALAELAKAKTLKAGEALEAAKT
ncbi:MAG: hypothetical protein FJY85_07060, partial [Deltaproteobacteria bacterium]|nr:hypothetical protein [Deltaproteobacteria bacterium]